MAQKQLSAADKKKLLGKVMGDINKKAGRTVIGTVKDPEIADLVKIDFLPTPSVEMNVMLNGGFPRGKIIELFGEHASGKTSMAIETMALDMKNDPDSYWGWYETEGSFDIEYARQFDGFDEDRLIIWHIEDEGAEKGLDFLEAMLRTGQFKGIIVNSVAGLTPAKEMESELAKQDIALQARMMSKLMRKITGVASKNKTVMIFINQFRTNVGAMFGDPNVTTGGRALAFYSTQRIGMRKVKLEKSDGISDDEGMKVSARVAKNRVAHGNPYKATKYTALYGEGIDRVRGVALTAVENEIVQGGSWIYYPNKDMMTTLPDGSPAKWNGMGKFVEYLKQHPDFVKLLADQIEAKAKAGSIKVDSLDEDEIQAIKDMESKLEDDFEEADEE
jgi:recombination protein RecA